MFGFPLLTSADGRAQIFFGGCHCEMAQLAQGFPAFRWGKIKQVHGTRIVPASSDLEDADAQWTIEKNFALIIQTADCIPLMIYSPLEQKVMALHLGWRGVQGRLFPLALERNFRDTSLATMELFLGPHIGAQSFEVGQDVAELLSLSLRRKPNPEDFIKFENKVLVNLAHLVISQGAEYGLASAQFTLSPYDTLSEERFYSYRRHPAPNRNLSFISLIP